MRPNVYGGYCALENNLSNTTHVFRCLPRPAIVQQQTLPINQQSIFSRQQYTNSLSLPPITATIHRAQQQQQQVLCFNSNSFPNATNNVLNNAQSASYITANSQTNQQIYSPKPLVSQQILRPYPETRTPAIHFQHAHTYNVISHNTTLRQLPPPQSLRRSLPGELANAHNYSKQTLDAVNQQRILECAGIPLISTVYPQRQRLQRKSTASSVRNLPAFINQPDVSSAKVQPTYNRLGSASKICENVQNDRRNNISRTTVHAQGSPLLLQKSTQLPAYWSTTYGSMPQPRLKKNSSIIGASLIDKSRLCYEHSAPAVLNTQDKENFTQATAELSSNPGTLLPLINVDMIEDSNKTCLPRIIKPRKRRKKDRKSGNAVLLKFDIELESKSSTFIQETFDRTKSFNHINTMPNIYDHKFQKQQGKVISSKAALQQFPIFMEHKVQSPLEIHKLEGNCYCSNCNSLRSIWEYPLRRSFSNASNSSANETCSKNSGSPILFAASSSPSSSTISRTESNVSANSLASSLKSKEDPENFSPITTDSRRANVVGVIGSNRVNNHESHKSVFGPASYNYQHPMAEHSTVADASTCLSDSNDSGFGDILTGINIADDLFKHVKSSELESQTPTRTLLLPSSAAETLLTASINEISRQLIETCINESATTTSKIDHHSTFSKCSDISSDSGLDSGGSLRNCDEVVFKFDDISLNEKNLFQDELVDTEYARTLPTSDVFLDFNNNTINDSKDFSLLRHNNNSDIVQNDMHDKKLLRNCYGTVWRDLSMSKSVHAGNVKSNLLSKIVY